MININNAISHFRTNSLFTRDGEVPLFRQLAKSILRNSRGIFIDETHGTKATVEFTSSINGKQNCEISDLILVTKNTSNGLIRATFWQAKKESQTKWPLNTSDINFDFKAQFNQWELLSQRPLINGTSNFKPPSDLLSNALSPSIGSFGVFHEVNGNIEVNFSVAEAVSSSGISKHPRMVINNQLSKYLYASNEAVVRKDMQSFLKAINEFQIGTLLLPKKSTDIWLATYLNRKCKSINKKNFIDEDWFIEPPISDNSFEPCESDGISVLMIEIE